MSKKTKSTKLKKESRGKRKAERQVAPQELPKAAQDTAAPLREEPLPLQQPARDARLPPPGTVLQKRDRHGNVRCECAVEEHGIRYKETLYKSLSAAAMAAARDLGLNNKTQNGFTFWGLSKPPRHATNPLAGLEHAWERYQQCAANLADSTGEDRGGVRVALEAHLRVLTELAGALR